jgi:two-component system cell cycle sensor histidine kinase/response regulator CckA
VLLLEDEPHVRQVMEVMLDQLGYRVIATEDGKTALEQLTPDVDLLLTDIVLAEERGTDVAEQAKARFPDLHLLYMSGYAPENIGTPTPFLEKPFRMEQLARALEEAFAS